MVKTKQSLDTPDVRDALLEVQATQTAFWHALSTLESVTGIQDLPDHSDFEDMTIEDLEDIKATEGEAEGS